MAICSINSTPKDARKDSHKGSHKVSRKNSMRLLALSLVSFALVLLLGGGCTLRTDSKMNDKKIQVSSERHVEKTTVDKADDAFAKGVAAHYLRYGDGPMDLTVTYDPRSRQYTAMRASELAAYIVNRLNKAGVRHVVPGILPVRDIGHDGEVIVGYESYTAHAPEDCKLMSGMESKDITVEEDYKLGCTYSSLLARQVARPRDLLGGSRGGENYDGRRASNIGERYRSGAPNEDLGGESASGD